MRKGETTRVGFPLPQRVELADTPAGRYVTHWKGYTVTRMDPPGTFLPLYADRNPEGPMSMVKKRYFHPAKVIDW